MISADVKNQTPKECMGNPGLGTGLFYVPSFSSGKLEGVVQAMKNISYEEAQQYGEPCIAFKWVPLEIMAYEELKRNCPTAGQRCSAPDCGLGCLCGGSFADHRCQKLGQ